MVAILSNRIQNEMNNTVNTKELNDNNTTNKDHQVHVQQSRSPPLVEPSTQSEVRDSQEVDTTEVPPTPQVKTPAVKAAPSTAPTANMSDASYKKTPSFDDQREEEQSAFVSNVQGVEPSPSTTEKKKQDQQDDSNQSIASAIMGRAKRSIEDSNEVKQEQQPSDDTPLRYYHQQDHPTPQVHNNSRGAYPHYHQQYQGYPPPHYHHQGQQHPYSYPGYYQQPPPQRNTEQDSNMNNSSDIAEGSTSQQQHHNYANYHQGYTQGYEHQAYARHHPQEYHHSGHQYQYPPHPGHYSHPNQSYYPGVGRSGSTEASAVSHSASTEQKETASAVTESTKGTTAVAQDRSLSMEEDDRKLSASEASAAVHQEGSSSNKAAAQPKSILKKDVPPAPVRAFSDYEPIPLHAFSAVPDLSTSSASAKRSRPLSPASYARLYGGHQFVGTFAEPFPQYEGGMHSSPQEENDDEVEFISSRRTPASAPAATKRARRTEVSPHKAPTPPRSNPPARRRRRDDVAGRVLEASASLPSEGGSWERRFCELVEYKAVHGDCEVPQNYSQNTSLGTWVNKQRMEQKNRIEGKNSSLNDARLERLESIGFRWAKRKGQEAWDEKFNELLGYKERFGNCHVPTKYKDNTALGRWVSTQRSEYKKYNEGGIKTSMNADKIRRLEAIGFAWFMAL